MLGWIEVGSCSHHKRTVPEFVWSQTETTSSTRSPSGCFRPHPSAIDVVTSSQTNCTKGVKAPGFDVNLLCCHIYTFVCVSLYPPDVQQLLIIKEEGSHEWSPSLDQKNPEPRHIKQEQEELRISQEGAQLNWLREADITRFPFTAVTLKSEDDEDKPQTSQLHQSLTEDNGEAEPPTSSSATQIKTEN